MSGGDGEVAAGEAGAAVHARDHGAARVTPETLAVIVLTLALASFAWFAGRPLFGLDAVIASPHVPWWALAIAFVCTESVVLHIQIEREAQTVSISELPLVLGLFFVGGAQLVVARLVGSVLVFVVQRRSSPLKTAFNLALVSAETVIAMAVFRWVAGRPTEVVPSGWAGAFAGALLANVFGAVAIGLVIAVYERQLRPAEVLRDAVLGQPAAPIVVTIALVAATSLSADPRTAWLLGAAGVCLMLAYRTYAGLSDRHLSLERLYRFSQVVSRSPEIDEVLVSVLSEARSLLRSEQAEVIFVAAADGGGAALVHLGPGEHLHRSEHQSQGSDAWLQRRVIGENSPVLLPRASRDPDVRAWLDGHGVRDAVAVPLRGSAGIVGILLVGERMGEVRTFDDSDVQLLETVANHASMALQNGALIDKLRHEALHDVLTGMPNRTHLQRALSDALGAVAQGRSAGAAAMILDLDRFKDVNDTLGHQLGDQLLVEVAARITSAVGEHGFVGRLGGDEFAVLLTDTSDHEWVVRMAKRVIGSLEHPFELDGLQLVIGGSIGIALASVPMEPAVLLKQADMAMYHAKGSGSGVSMYDPALDTNTPRRLALASELRTAMQTDAICLHFQPQAYLTSGEVRGVEALARWHHPDLGSIPPDEFVPMAERSGLIGQLTRVVLDRALTCCAGWRREGLELSVAVNLSARSLLDADLVEQVRQLLVRHAVPARLLTLEITESGVMADPSRALGLLAALRDLGVRLSVDDFGTGYSSLSYLKRLPVDEVKIDRSFVSTLRTDNDDAAIVRSIVDLGANLGLDVVAEGSEDEATSALLAEMGCTLVQGWHLSPPMPAPQVGPWMRERLRERMREPLTVREPAPSSVPAS